LQPKSQIAEVDRLWQEHFPESEIKSCPLFAHSNDQFREYLPGDVMPVSMIPKDYTSSRLIVAKPKRDWGHEGSPIIVNEFSAETMLETEYWNGVDLVSTEWHGNVVDGLKRHENKVSSYRGDAAEEYRVRDNWICVTVDYHS
jgi:hypothetical protein